MANLFDRLPGRDPRRRPRGVFLLPSLFTVGNLFCGYACIVHSMTGQLETAAPFIGIAIILDMLDGRIARLTNTTSAFGVEFDSLADVISFGAAPAILAFSWGLKDLGQIGWAAGFIFLSAAAMRLARFNIQTSSQGDKRYFIGMPTSGRGWRGCGHGVCVAGVAGPARNGSGGHFDAGACGADGQHDQIPQLQDDQFRMGPVLSCRCWASSCSCRSSRRGRRSRWYCLPTVIWRRALSSWRSRS
jgi:CDP-diacylglycerol--serine O-phosphatidyltransferase